MPSEFAHSNSTTTYSSDGSHSTTRTSRSVEFTIVIGLDLLGLPVCENSWQKMFHFPTAQKAPQNIFKIIPGSLCSTAKRNQRALGIAFESMGALEFNGTNCSHLSALMVERGQCC